MKTTETIMRWLLTGSLVIFTLSHVAEGTRQDDTALRLRTDLVSLGITVTDNAGVPVTGLQREDFEVYEDKIRQEIEYFSDVDKPATVGVVFDHSGSMRLQLERARSALQHFIESSHPQDEYFLVNFNERVTKSLDAGDSHELLRRLQGLTPQGNTALYDAVYFALERLRQSRLERRALLIVSDGVDNHSRYGIRELKQQLREANVTIYAIGSADQSSSSCGRLCQFEAAARLESLATMTGGKAYFPHSFESLEKAVSQIAVELRRQYSLGYVPNAQGRTGGWRRISVRLKDRAKVSVRTREGYFAGP